MHLDRILAICPFLFGSADGVICKASGNRVRDIQDIHPDICISKHFEMCHIYISQLQDPEELYAYLYTQTPDSL
jgi:hypothetical protein